MLKDEVVQNSVEGVYAEEKKAEEALRGSEEKYRSIVELAPDIIVTSDLKGVITSFNTAGTRISGYSEDEVVGKHFSKIGHIRPTNLPKYLKMFNSIVRGKVPEPLETIFIHKNGTPRLVEVRVSLLKQNGKPTGILAIIRDITERKKAEEEIGNLAKFPSENPSPVLRIAKDGIILYANAATKSLLSELKTEIGQPAPHHWRRLVADALNSGLRKEIEVEHRDRIFLFILTPVTDTAYVNVYGLDITERKRAEEALRKSESKYRTLLENLPQKIFFKDKNSVYISCNENYARDLKIKSDEITGKTDYDFYPKILAEKYKADDKRAMESGKTEDIEEEYIQDGQKVFVHTVKTPVKDENGNVAGILGIFWDVTERKQARETLRESEEKYRNLFENARDIILTLDLKGNVTAVNKIAEEYGFKRDEIIGKNMLKFVSKKYWPRLLKDLAQIVQGKSVKNEIEIGTSKGNRLVEYRSTPIIKDNKVVGLQTIMRDITERKEMEEKLRQYSEHLEELVQKRTQELSDSERRYSLLVEQASDGIGISQDAKAVFVNKKLSEMLGYSKDEMIGRPIFELIHEKYRQLTKESYEEMQKERGPATRYFETEFVAKNGTLIPVELSTSRINYENRNAAMIIVRDIGERKRMEEQRLKLEKLATIGELTTMVGHDLRNPLQSIENAVYVLTDVLSQYARTHSLQIPQKAVEMVQVINDSVNYADKIIRDLQDFSATKTPKLEKTDINTIIKETLSQIQIPKSVELRTELVYLPEIKADKDQMKRVFFNLIINGMQAMENGGTLTVSTKKTEGWVEISFKDTGAGISKENMEKIFSPFFTTRAKGIGMGLPICKKFVETNGGNIDVESEAGKGTTFTVKLPYASKERR